MPAVDAGHPDLCPDSIETESAIRDAAAIWRDHRVEVVGFVGALDGGDHEVQVGSVGAHDPDRAAIRRTAGEHDVPAVRGVFGLLIAESRRVGGKPALSGSI